MVTGFLLQGVMLYTANTGDMRYTEPESLVFNIEDKLAYKYAVQDLQERAVIYDRVFGTRSTEIILPSFEESLNTNFTEPSGSVLPIRSELTGFTIPGLCGASGDLATVIMGAGPLRNLSRRLWAIVRKENVRFDQKTGSLSLTGLVGADAIDQGNYRANEYAMYPYIAIAAAEHGDERLKEAAMLKFEQAWGLVTTSTGAKSLDLTKASTLMNYAALTATLIRPGGYERMVKKGPSNTALKGPILSEVPYPGVLVAKARSHMSTDLEIVLYPSADPGTFKLGISRLQPGKSYAYGMKTLVADGDGNLSLDILVDGRTHVHLKPVTI
ncbi:putative linalool dehydratase-isomerase precursor protein [Phaeoacremonium minimum UCRPA7]|uniref:Putative linalool dehydratase-isomerase protein n=1 Tax=Phaeoacremonium minimum (strain UCR-PA7) TaxID=1286976 RepID=R8B8X2_PHAM7|nr:putative linalool dehydratase-isomerase precursor protein [Phaeoacremonium minimum UCRPA7]EON95759.1 putative linalool dehydratase-isomerase precursor protein [Phaeoacremonium minimum UCRPA7]